jgi:prepilin-type N-terminal cleavage/methylation domain-containing protein
MWNTNSRQNNNGMTLVELLVALAVSSIILTGLSFMLVSVLKLYARTNANVEAQNESQTALNLVIDSVIGAKGVCLQEWDWDSDNVDSDKENNIFCILLGDLTINADGKSAAFKGDAIMWQPSAKEMYLMSFSGDDESSNCSFSDKAEAPLKAIENAISKLPANGEERLPYLMAQNVSSFNIVTHDSCFKEESGEYYFENPVVFDISLEIEYTYQYGKEPITRTIEDSAYIRNHLKYVYIQKEGSSMIKYLCSTN